MEHPIQLTLPLFAPPGFEDLIDDKARLSFIVNPRLKRGWQVKFFRFSRRRELIISPALNEAPSEIKQALIAWALLPFSGNNRQSAELRARRSSLEKTVHGYLAAHPVARRRIKKFDPAHFTGTAQGTLYDLQHVFDSVNNDYFSRELHAFVRWGRPGSTTSYHMTKTDSNNQSVNLITIAGVYNHPHVPAFAISGVMYHEMLHIAVPTQRKNGRRVVHGREFKLAEKTYAFFDEWRAWERKELILIAREIRRTLK